MLRMKVIETALRSNSVKSLIKRCATTHSGTTSTHNVNGTNKEDDDDDDLLNKPIKFSTSKAATFPANGMTFDNPPYQGVCISTGLAIFLIYFCCLREENDIDEELTNPSDPEIQNFLADLKKQQEQIRFQTMKDL